MPDGQAPELPATAPIELREFIECKRASVTITSGPLDWLPLPPDIKDFAPTPKLDLTPGASPGTGTMTIDLTVTSFTLPVSVVGGDLQIDSSGLSSIPGAQDAIDTWVKDFNDWLKKNGKRLKQTTIAGGSVTLTKEPIPVPPPGVAPPPAPPGPPVAPVTPTPPAGGGGIGGGCALFGLLGVLLVGAIGFAWFSGLIPGSGGGGSVASASPTASTVAVTVPSATASATAIASTAAQPSTSAAPSRSAGTSAVPAPANAAPALAYLEAYAGMTDVEGAFLEWYADPTRDMYFPQPGQTPEQYFPESDLTGAAAFSRTLTAAEITAIMAASKCAADAALADGTKYRTACNQDKPLEPGDYAILITTQAGGYPAQFPSAGLHSWAVMTNPDDDLATGYTSQAADNYLIGADTYHETLAFTDASGKLSYYTLATRMSDPVRADTGQRQGNLPTRARTVWFYDIGTQVWFIPASDFGPNWHAGNFASLNRGANSPANLAADARFSPAEQEWLRYEALRPLIKP